MVSTNIDTIIFDLGGVLIDWNPRYLFKKLFDSEQEMDYFFDNIATFDWNEQQDGGKLIKDATEELVVQHPDYEVFIRAYYGRWKEMLGGAIEGTVELLQALKNSGEYRLFALTNWSAETYPIAIEQFEFLQWFDDVLVSGREKIKKPDPKIYQLTLERFKIDAHKAIFIDDNLRNVKAAEQQGITSIHFKSPKQLKDILSKKGILN